LTGWIREDFHGRIVAAAAVAVVGIGVMIRLDRREWALMLGAVGLVGAAEALNSGMEALADALHPSEHPGIGRAKEIAAGGVLLAILVATAIGACVIVPRIVALIRNEG